KLETQPLSAQNIGALHSMSQCAIDGECQLPAPEIVGCFRAALERSQSNIHVLSDYANYAANVLHDGALAVELARSVVAQAPRDLQARKNLLLLLTATGQHDEATAFY